MLYDSVVCQQAVFASRAVNRSVMSTTRRRLASACFVLRRL